MRDHFLLMQLKKGNLIASIKCNSTAQHKTPTVEMHFTLLNQKTILSGETVLIFMPRICVEIRIQTMQKFYAISLTNVRPDFATENHWIKKNSLNALKFVFSLNVNLYNFLDKKTFNIKKHFWNISAIIAALLKKMFSCEFCEIS